MALALTLSAASLTGLWLGFRSGPVDRSDREGTAGEPVDLQPRVTAVIPVGPYPKDVAVGEGAVWVSVPAQEPSQDDLVVRIDPGTNEVVARIPVDRSIAGLAAGAGGVWVVGVQGTGPDPSFYVDRIDPATNEVVARIPDVSGPLVVGEGALWAVDHAGARAGPEGSSLLRIDPATNQIVARIPLGIAVWGIEFGEGYVWVLSLEPGPGEGDILQVDPATNEVVARIEIPLPGSVFAPALGDGSAWVPVCCADNEGMVFRVDVGTSQIVGEPIRLPAGNPFAFAAGHVWVLEERGALSGLNVATQEVDEMVSGFDWPAGGFPDPSTELDPARLVVWIANYQDSVTRIDLAATRTPSAEPDGASPSTELIVLFGGSGGGIYSLRADGTGADLIDAGGRAEDLAPAPDGTRIAFVGNGGIFVVDSDGTNEMQLTSGVSDTSPTWSPDGSMLAFSREVPSDTDAGNVDIFLVPAAAGDIRQLTNDPLLEYTPAWSPDGTKIAFVGYEQRANEPPSSVALYVMNSDGTDVKLLGGDGVAQPSWSPDGSGIVVVQNQNSVVAFAAAGSGTREVYAPESASSITLSPSWSPDGKEIAFITGPSVTELGVYVAAADGSGARKVSGGLDSPLDVVWMPTA